MFLHHFTAGSNTLRRSFTVWAALVDDSARSSSGGNVGRDLGAFPVDLAKAAAAESSHPRVGAGNALSFPLGGSAAGAVLTVSVYCRVMEQEEIDHIPCDKLRGAEMPLFRSPNKSWPS